MHSGQCYVDSAQYIVYNIKFSVEGVNYSVHSVQCTVYSVQCTVINAVEISEQIQLTPCWKAVNYHTVQYCHVLLQSISILRMHSHIPNLGILKNNYGNIPILTPRNSSEFLELPHQSSLLGNTWKYTSCRTGQIRENSEQHGKL